MLAEEFSDHAQHPRHKKDCVTLPFVGHAANPLCADVIDVGIALEGDSIVDAVFAGRGCAVCMGGASAMCSYIRGMPIDEVATFATDAPRLHIDGIVIGRMREGCVAVSITALQRALEGVKHTT